MTRPLEAMTFAQVLHRVLDHHFGDEAFERRDRKRVEKIEEGLWDKVFTEVWDEVWTEIPESLRNRMPDDFRERILQRLLNRRPAKRSIDATAA